jgi:predicted outer membrane repeat protein
MIETRKMKYKKLIFFIALLVLLVGVVNAADASDNETVADTADIIDSSTDTQSPIQTDVIEKNNNEIKPLKEASTSQTYNVTDYDTLKSALTDESYDKVNVNIKSHITLAGSISLSDSISSLKINGYGKTINGNNEYKLFTIKSDANTAINITNLKIINCYSSYGAIEKNGGTLTLKNVTFMNNKAEYGGAIDNYGGGKLTISQSTFTNNIATGNGGAIRSRTDLAI